MSCACSLSAWHCEWTAALDRAAALGFSGVDLMAIPGWQQLDPATLATDPAGWATRLAEGLASRGLRAVAFNAAVGAPHDPRERAAAREQVDALARIAAELGIGVISLYPGYLHRVEDRAAQAAAALPTLGEWAAIGRDHGVQVAIEVHWQTPWPLPDQAGELVDHGVPLVLDPSHNLAAGADPAAWEPLLAQVVHVHLRDAARDRLHVPWGEGRLDLPALARLLHTAGYSGGVAAEAMPRDGVEEEQCRIAADWDALAAAAITPGTSP